MLLLLQTLIIFPIVQIIEPCYLFVYRVINKLSDVIINDYAFLDTLDRITGFSEAGDTYTSVYAHLPHSTAFFQAPDYVPIQNIHDKGSVKDNIFNKSNWRLPKK